MCYCNYLWFLSAQPPARRRNLCTRPGSVGIPRSQHHIHSSLAGSLFAGGLTARRELPEVAKRIDSQQQGRLLHALEKVGSASLKVCLQLSPGTLTCLVQVGVGRDPGPEKGSEDGHRLFPAEQPTPQRRVDAGARSAVNAETLIGRTVVNRHTRITQQLQIAVNRASADLHHPCQVPGRHRFRRSLHSEQESQGAPQATRRERLRTGARLRLRLPNGWHALYTGFQYQGVVSVTCSACEFRTACAAARTVSSGADSARDVTAARLPWSRSPPRRNMTSSAAAQRSGLAA